MATNEIESAKKGSYPYCGEGVDYWFVKTSYDESIKKVIGKAIADCVTNMNEFDAKRLDKVITFKANPLGYSPENWNAVVLYNYVNVAVMIKDELDKDKKSTNQILDMCMRNLKQYYKLTLGNRYGDIEDKLAKAKKDITRYVNDMNFAINSFISYVGKPMDQDRQKGYTELKNAPSFELRFIPSMNRSRVNKNATWYEYNMRVLYKPESHEEKEGIYLSGVTKCVHSDDDDKNSQELFTREKIPEVLREINKMTESSLLDGLNIMIDKRDNFQALILDAISSVAK